MQQILINSTYGSFWLSRKAIERMRDLGSEWARDNVVLSGERYPDGKLCDVDGGFSDSDLDRSDPILIQVFNELGGTTSHRDGEMKLVEIPDNIEWQIEEYDGLEWVAEKHRTWG